MAHLPGGKLFSQQRKVYVIYRVNKWVYSYTLGAVGAIRPCGPLALPEHWTERGGFIMPQKDFLDALTPDQRAQIYLEERRAYYRQYQRDHPDLVLQQRIRAAINLLAKHGYLVKVPPQQEGRDA